MTYSKIWMHWMLLFMTSAGAVCGAETLDRVTPVVKVYQKTRNMVVNIAGKGVTRGSTGFDWSDPFGGGIFGPRNREMTVLGSGVVVHQDGYVLTNAHVVAGTDQIKVTFNDSSEYAAKLISADTDKDVALLKIEPKEKKQFPFIHFGRSDDLMVGETVIAIGNPLGFANTVTSGVVSAVNRDIQARQGLWLRGLIQTDAAINFGNSGGPLLNINGDLIGITTAISADAQNIGFAIPVDTIASNLTQMLMPEKLRRVQLGLLMGRMKTIGQESGLEVVSVVKDSPSARQDIKAGDIVVSIDGRKVTGFLDYFVKMIDKKVGEPIKIGYVKPAEPKNIHTAKLEMTARPLPDGKKLVEDFFQMQVTELTAEIARQYGFDRAYPVFIVTGVDDKGCAGQAGISAGDLLLALNGISVSNAHELSLIMEKISEGDTVNARILQVRQHGMMTMQQQYDLELKAHKGVFGKFKGKKSKEAAPERSSDAI